MANEQNLIPYRFTSDQNREEAAKNGALGGVASGAARRRKRRLREAADLYLSLPPSDMNVWNSLSQSGVDPEDIDNQMAVIAGLTMKAVQGDSKAAKALFDLLGEDGPAEEAAPEVFSMEEKEALLRKIREDFGEDSDG